MTMVGAVQPAAQLVPESAEAGRAGRLGVLPILLAGVLPAGGPPLDQFAACLRHLLTDDVTGEAWALSHQQVGPCSSHPMWGPPC